MSRHHLITCLVLILVLFSTGNLTGHGQQFSCDLVVQELSPCLSFLNQQATTPTRDCCQGVKSIWDSYGKSKGDRQSVCQCLESMLPYVGAIDESLVTSIPKQCRLKIKLPPVSNSFNCSRVS